MRRKWAVLLHVALSIAAGVLYFYFVLPRWPELKGDTTHALGTTLRIVAGALIGLAALPVVFTLLRTRKPELGTPQLALTIRTWSVVGHVLAGVLIIGTAISEIWLSLESAGQWLFGIYGAAAAVAVLGFFAFYLSFVAELPPPPPKPLKPKTTKQRRVRRKKKDDAEEEPGAETEEQQEEAETAEAEAVEASEGETTVAGAQAVQQTQAEPETEPAAEPEAATDEAPHLDEEPRSALRNRRPTGKTSHRRRRTRTRGGVTVED
ncbi:hypothetical protein B1987_13290 [Mycobacterium kansasii]|uniref:Transmembrane protein n=1 Tax=Mycobacterium attenuatum TaxID=2341086 RepID=A0A498QGA4_9MYCO|nr:hypothetical protein [Mycobacterium attenuatum]ORB84605.1 hypothetical protein B1987_13290 [Mycobacterium kansasii]VBA43784.1 hypothetical protein LAUMK136_05280 [Mycobacterium attenuatum]VBA59923.1 hypothetical protein LAUMK191_05256 [Mycobacterium attenuatum]VBA62033.1 hypothetical protein LAUMK41_05420 [Mycobacterium attenuatum]